jgi:hypothetical protein
MVTYDHYDLNRLQRLKESIFAYNPRLGISFLSYIAIKKQEEIERKCTQKLLPQKTKFSIPSPENQLEFPQRNSY